MKEQVTFLIWTQNRPGVLLRLTTLFTRRKINVESLTVSVTEVEGISRFTIAINSDPVTAATIGRQVERMVDVRRVFVFEERDVVHREVVLLRARISEEVQKAMQRSFPLLLEIERREDCALLQFTGPEDEVEKLLRYLEPYGLIEFVRSGRIAVSRTGDYESDLSRSLHELRPEASVGPDM